MKKFDINGDRLISEAERNMIAEALMSRHGKAIAAAEAKAGFYRRPGCTSCRIHEHACILTSSHPIVHTPSCIYAPVSSVLQPIPTLGCEKGSSYLPTVEPMGVTGDTFRARSMGYREPCLWLVVTIKGLHRHENGRRTQPGGVLLLLSLLVLLVSLLFGVTEHPAGDRVSWGADRGTGIPSP